MKPKQVTLYETSSGATVKTLEEWKRIEIALLIDQVPMTPKLESIAQDAVAGALVSIQESVIDILSVREKGRPLNRKDSKPRKPRVVAGEGKAA